MKKKADKQRDLESLRKEFQEANNLFLTGFAKMTVEQDFQLRKAVREAGGRYKVIKNNLAVKASEGTSAEALFKNIAGMTSMAVASDPVALAKALTAYAKAHPALTFKAGLVEGRVIDVKAIGDLSNMPSKEQLYAKLLYVINAPARQLVTAINGVGRNLAVVVEQGVKENKFAA